MKESTRRTEELLALLFKEQSLAHFFQQEETSFELPPFCEYISALCKKRGEVPERVIARANLEKSYGHQLFTGKRNPSRDTVLQLAFGFEASVEEAQEMLKIARKSPLYPRAKRDTAVIYCLHNHISLVDTQIILYDLGLLVLGGKRNDGL